jgi:hypothetical protein
MSKEVEPFFPGVQYPRLLGIQCQTEPIKNQLGLFQIKLWTFFAQDDKSSSAGESHPHALTGRVEVWRGIP